MLYLSHNRMCWLRGSHSGDYEEHNLLVYSTYSPVVVHRSFEEYISIIVGTEKPVKVPGINRSSWRLKRQVPPKRPWTFTKLHSVTTQKMIFFSNPCFDSLLKMRNNKINMMDLKFSQQWLSWDAVQCSLVHVFSAGFLVVSLFGFECFKCSVTRAFLIL
jgi:hypothetical protein